MLKQDNAVLVIIDIQGKLATLMHNKEKFYENVVIMIKGARILGLPIVWNEQLPDKLGETIDQIKDQLSGYQPLAKKSFSCSGNPDFVKAVKESGRKQVLIVGMESHVCVYQTVRDLIADGFEVFLASDGVSSRTEENRRVGLEACHSLGAKLYSVEMALFEMLNVAEGDQFKQVVRILK